MSYINEALKKAQREKNGSYGKYDAVVSARGKRTSFFRDNTFWWTFLLAIIIFLAFASYSWLDFRIPQTPAISEYEYQKPAATSEPEDEKDAKKLFKRARLFHKSGRLQDARRMYQETLRIDPGYVNALNNLGVIYIHEKDFLAARSTFEKAIRLKPEYVDSYYNLACLYALKGEVSKALAHLKRAVSLDQSAKDWALKDRDMKNLRKTPEFEVMMREVGIRKEKDDGGGS